MNKVYQRAYWESKPSEKTPINESNLNKMDYALDEIDTRVVQFSRQKDAMETATQNANTATANANTATANANKATDFANLATEQANTAATNANEAAQAVFDEKYILTARTEFAKSASVSPTAKGNAIIESVLGDSFQKQLSGKNLMKASTYYSTLSGVTATINDDGSVTLNGTASAMGYIEVGRNTVPAGEYILTGCPSGGSGKTYQLVSVKPSEKCDVGYGVNVTLTEATTLNVRIYVYSGATFNNLTFYPMFRLATETDATYEPYCGGTASPNPSYSQEIESVGDSGYFDGEWLQGNYNATNGAYQGNANSACCANAIPCKGGDTVTIKSEIAKKMRFAFYNGSTLVSRALSDNVENEYSAEVPSGADNFKFWLYDDNSVIDLSAIGKVSVTINGKYPLTIKAQNKNLLKLETLGEDYNNNNSSVSSYSITEDALKLTAVTKNSYHCLSLGIPMAHLKGKTFTLSANSDIGGCVKFGYLDGTVRKVVATTTSGTIGEQVCTGAYPTDIDDSCIPIIWFYCDVANSTITFTDIQLEAGATATNYVAHAEHEITIPLSEPLRAINGVKDEICVQDGVYGVLRNPNEETYDGSETDWVMATTNHGNGKLFYIPLKETAIADTVTCSHFILEEDVQALNLSLNHCRNTSTTFYVVANFASIDEWKAWLVENNVKIQYNRATPVFEPFADQTPFYELMAYDEVTNISFEGLSENVSPTATIRFPRNEDGALVTTNWCDNKKNEIKMEELTAALLALSQE